jgi:gliding motility-associated-like protein
MRKPGVIFFILFLFCQEANANHITGGEMYYTFTGQNGNEYTYHVTLKLYRDCFSTGSALDPTAAIAIFNRSSNSLVWSSNAVPRSQIVQLQISAPNPCITNPPQVCYQVGYYEFDVTLPGIASGYLISYQRCCRIIGINNLINSSTVGATYTAEIPGNSGIASGPTNNSAKFAGQDTVIVCASKDFSYNFGAVDPDASDNLTYSFCNAYPGGTTTAPAPAPPSTPPYISVPYSSGYSSSTPLGLSVNINPNTGLITGTAPTAGIYVVTVCVNEIRNGVLIATQRKDLQIKVADCDFVAAQLPLSAVFCDDFNVGFANQTPTSLIYSWHWDFGINSTLNDTSNMATPSFTYPDTGIYIIKLVVNSGDPCSDSATMQIGLYPGFFPDFVSSGICVTKPTSFIDASTTTYGVVSGWQWNFGESSASDDTSRLRNPVYTYPTLGLKNAQLIVQSSKGCVDTVTKAITIIDKPPITLPFRDTLICNIDTLQLSAAGSGVFAWTPNYNIILANTANPLVYPKTTTWYKVLLDDNGCVNTDSIQVRVTDRVTVTVRPDTTYCAGDGVQLYATTNGLQFSWTPNSNLNDPNIINPIANPPSLTTYQLTAKVGNCSSSDDVRLIPVPYPLANAGPDVSICYNASVQLNASVVASSYFWRPQGSLNDPNILNPIAHPASTTKYILTATDVLGCPKPSYDTVVVTVLPKVKASAGRDTMIVFGQPLQLTASGGENYLWTPPAYLNNTSIPNPVAKINSSIDSIRYKVFVTDQLGCLDSATILVKIFRTNPQIFVPTGFTPNGDGRNDVLKPIAVGIERIEYFKVFNRWGQLVFSTTVNGHGWNGEISGKPQTTNTYVWLVKAVDYTGKPVFQKGTATLIR